MGREAFRSAAESGDMVALAGALDPDISFRGPALPEEYRGRETVAAILATAYEKVYQDFAYVDVVEGAKRTVLLFTARVGAHQLEGAQVLTFGEADTVTELVVMVRPAPAAQALGEGIMSHLARDPGLQT